MMKRILTCAVIVAASQANAGVVINIVESGGNVDLTLSGNINMDALGDFFGSFNGFNGYEAFDGAISVTGGLTDTYTVDISPDPTVWTPFGAGTFGQWDTSSGDAWSMFSNPVLGVPAGYVSGNAISSNATKFGATFNSLGFVTGSYVSTITGVTGVSDTITVNIGNVPTPGTLAMLGLAGIAGTRRRR